MAWALPLFAAIDRKLAENGRVVLAIEGGAGSGKTTLADLLRRVYGAVVFHMDDFFLRPEQRTQARLEDPGGNVDRERVLEEILQPISRGEGVVHYRPYDCAAQALGRAVTEFPAALTVVEGAYSMHPELAGHYDLSVFLRQTPETQRRRVLHRNGQEMAQRFFSTWIPMENRYFEVFDTANRCDLILEVEP
ncbi:MAG: phosphoribulokinase [Ruminococcaceae bacterium]|nr:phosphoribulokinase [Oscillospiraceae bacterium]